MNVNGTAAVNARSVWRTPRRGQLQTLTHRGSFPCEREALL
jgi:hypothetical protein